MILPGAKHTLNSRWDLIVKVQSYTERRALSVGHITFFPLLKPVASQYFNALFSIIKVLSYSKSSVIFIPHPTLLCNFFQVKFITVQIISTRQRHDMNTSRNTDKRKRRYIQRLRSRTYLILQLKCILIPELFIVIFDFLHLCQESFLKTGSILLSNNDILSNAYLIQPTIMFVLRNPVVIHSQ